MKLSLRTTAGLALGAVVAAGLVTAQSYRSDITQVERLLTAVQAAGPLGWLVFATVQAMTAMLGIVPASLLDIGAGLAYGIGLGFLLAAAGTLLGGWIAFQLSRSLLRPCIARLLAKRMRAARLDDAIARDGWKFVCLLRISPIMPFAVTSYALGLTQIRRRTYLLGTLASLPALLGYLALGALANEGLLATQRNAGPLRWALLAAEVTATGLVTLRIGRMLAATGLLPGAGGVPQK